MQILEIRVGRYKVGAILKTRASGFAKCPVMDDLEAVEAQQRASRNRMYAHFETVSRYGLSGLNSDQFHQIDPANGIYELIAGRLRTLFFSTESGQYVVCTNVFVKKTQKTPIRELNLAVAAAKQFRDAQKMNQVTWVEDYEQN